MVRNLIDGNRFGGRLLVKIDRVKTNNPKPISKTPILFDMGGDGNEASKAKSKLFANLAEEKKKKGLVMANYDKSPPKKTKKLAVYFELF